MEDDSPEIHPLAQAVIDAHEQLAPAINQHKRDHLEGVLHQLEADLAPLIGPIVQRVLDDPGASDELKGLLAEAGTPAHQFGSLVVGFAIGSVVGPALGAAIAPEIEVVARNAWALNPSRPVPPDIAAASVLKGVITQTEGEQEAVKSGYNTAAFDQMVQASGQSIGIAEALLLYRRGQITLAHLQQIVKYSNVNPNFYDDIPKLQYGAVPAGEVISGALKGHLDDPTAQTYLAHAGIDPANFGWMRQTAGRPPGVEQMLELRNRSNAGLTSVPVTDADVGDAVRQSDINDHFLPFVMELGHYFPPPRSIVPMLRSNGITEAQARQLLTAYGVGEPWASAFIAEAHHTSSTTVKELTSAQVTRMYEAQLIDRPTANARLLALKYPQGDATLLLDFADDARKERLLNATITRVGTKYVAHRLPKNDAVHLLNTAGVPNAAQTDLFALWDIQRDANVIVPSAAQVVGAYRREEITALETKTRLTNLGVQAQDLAIIVADGWPPTHPIPAQQAAAAVVAA